MELTLAPHGQAALTLCKGLMLLLVERGTIDKDQAIDVMKGIIEVKWEIVGARENIVVGMTYISLLRSISASAGHSSIWP